MAITSGPSNFTRAQVPWALDLAAAWAWRLLVIAAGTWLLLWLIAFFAVVVLPLVDRAADRRALQPGGPRAAAGSACRGAGRRGWS